MEGGREGGRRNNFHCFHWYRLYVGLHPVTGQLGDAKSEEIEKKLTR